MESKSRNSELFNERESSIQEQNFPIKSYEELNLMDSFLFEAATEKPENAVIIAKVIIERATGRKVKKLIVETQKELKGINVNMHGIRMDVYTAEVDDTASMDETICVYDIEPNNYYDKDIPRRNRYYQSMIDSKLLPTSSEYKNLPDMFSIWILPYDPFDDERMVYTVKNLVTENNQIVYNDGVTKIFLYTKGTVGGSEKLKELLTFMESSIRSNAVDDELLDIMDIVDVVKSDPEERRRYMGIMGVIDYEKRDAYDIGHSNGFEDGLEEGIQKAIKVCKKLGNDENKTREAIMEQFSLTEVKVKEYMTCYWDKAAEN